MREYRRGENSKKKGKKIQRLKKYMQKFKIHETKTKQQQKDEKNHFEFHGNKKLF